MTKSCKAGSGSLKIWTCTKRVHIPINFVTLLFISYIYISESEIVLN